MRNFIGMVVGVALVGCGPADRSHGHTTGSPGSGAQPSGPAPTDTGSGGGAAGQQGCGELQGCYTVYAHSDHDLYHIDLPNKLLVEIGPFRAPDVGGKEDVITDLAVSTDDRVYAISKTNLYTADAKDGHVTLVAPITACGNFAVALTFTPDGSLYAADYEGAFCKIDLTAKPPTVTQIGTLGNDLAIAGDLVAVDDGTIYGTAYNLNDTSTDKNNILVKIDPKTGAAMQTLGQTGFPNLFGIAFSDGKVFGFTHDGSGDVVTIDPRSGRGTLYNRFTDPSTGRGIGFAGAAVNSKVPPPPIG
jgi:hypothetical protein